MARSVTLASPYGGDPLRALEQKRAEESGKFVSKRDRAAWGNKPIPEMPRRPIKAFEAFLAEQATPKPWSQARKELEALFSEPVGKIDG